MAGSLLYSFISNFLFISCTSLSEGVPSTLMIYFSWSIWESPMKGGVLLIISTRTQPVDHMSIWVV